MPVRPSGPKTHAKLPPAPTDRTRKRRTRSYDPVKATPDDGQRSNPHHIRHQVEGEEEDDSDAWASPVRGGAGAYPRRGGGGGGGSSEFCGRGGVLPTSLFGAPSVYDSKLMAVRKIEEQAVCVWCVLKERSQQHRRNGIKVNA